MKRTTATSVSEYNQSQSKEHKDICELLELTINTRLKNTESKIWHGSPVWFLDGNPIVAYNVRKNGTVSLMFFSGQSFGEEDLLPEGKFKAAEIFYTDVKEIKMTTLKRWLKKAQLIQRDYKNIVKNKGVLEMIQKHTKKSQINNTKNTHDQRFAKMIFASVYPLYLTKVEKRGRTKEELDHVIEWLTGFDTKTLQKLINEKVTFEEFFKNAKLHKNTTLITGVICGYRIEDIKNPLTKKVRYLDKLVDELARGKSIGKILRTK